VTGVARAASDVGPDVVGREPQLAAIDAFLAAGRPNRALVVTGGPGIGKTTLWEAGVATARERGLRALSARPSDAEARPAFAALIDLFDTVDSGELRDVPPPQLEALEVALLRKAAGGSQPDPHAIALGFLNALRGLAASDPVLIAVDDVQWLDAPSASALEFAARRLDGGAVGFLLARRPGTVSSLEHVLDSGGVERLELGPLTLGATRRLLHARLGLTLSRQLMRRIYDATLGSPLFALELGRQLLADGPPAIGEDLPVPDSVEDLLGTRVTGLPPGQRRLLLAVALSPNARVGQLAALPEFAALDDAVEAGVLVVDGDHVRAWHPLLAAAVTIRSSAAERREVHRALAETVAEGEPRIRHLALAAARPDPELAGQVAAAAADAAGRGAVQAAVELADHALRLTPHDDDSRSERLLELGGYLEVAGEKQRVTDLLEPALEWLPAGRDRARAFLILAEGALEGYDDIQRYFELALGESEYDPVTRALVLATMAPEVASVRVERIHATEAWAREALSTPAATPEVVRLALFGLGWARSLAGRAIDDVCDEFRAVSETAYYVAESPERVAGQRHVWRGEIDDARAALTQLLVLADDRGEPSSYALQRLHLCELELRVGQWPAAERLLDEWAESSDRRLLPWPMYERCRALLAAGRGHPDEAEQWAEEAFARAEATGVRWDRLEALRCLGMVELLRREPGKAAERLRSVWEHTEREGVEDPGVFPVAPDLVEALVALGELEEALSVTRRLGGLAEAQAHPWGLATTRRCAAIVRLAREYDERDVSTVEEVANDYASLGLPFDRARTLLALGRAERRVRKWGAARDTLEEAAAAFDDIGSPGWAAAARSDLSRVGARRSTTGGALTAAERRVAELAAQGLANKEIAGALVVTVNTVEYHLTNAYAKLGIRSRAQLAARIAEAEPTAHDGG
jgi:DNA-binding NarL/FixJ family response regulator